MSGTVLTSVHYVSTCCDFSQQSFTSTVLAVVLFVLSTAMAGLFVVLLVRSVKDKLTYQRDVKRGRPSAFPVDDTEPGTTAEQREEQAEYAAMEQAAGRLNRSDSVTSTGSFVPRSKREQCSFMARAALSRVRVHSRRVPLGCGPPSV